MTAYGDKKWGVDKVKDCDIRLYFDRLEELLSRYPERAAMLDDMLFADRGVLAQGVKGRLDSSGLRARLEHKWQIN